MAFPLLAAGLGLKAGSSILGGFFGSNQKKNEAAIARYNAAVTRMNAEAVRKRTKFQQVRQAEEAARILGEKEAAIGGSGLVSTQGAPMLALSKQETELELENYLIGLEGRTEAGQLESQAVGFDVANKMAKIGARQSLIGGFLGAGADAFTAYSLLPKTQTPPDITKTNYAYKSYRPSSGYGLG